MKTKILAGLAVLMSVLCGAYALAGSSYAMVTCPPGSLHDGEKPTYAECNMPDNQANSDNLMETVVRGINVVVGVVGVIAVIVIVIGAIFFVVSTGEPAKTTRARNTILYGVIGLIVSLLAFAIVNFVLTAVFSGGSGGSTGDQSETTQNSNGTYTAPGSRGEIK